MTKKCICSGSIVIKDGKVLLLKHKKLGVWLYPGGHVDADEIPTETAVRETLEETGYEIELLKNIKGKLMESAIANQLAQPLLILYEYVPYKDKEPHMHFDIVYLGRVKGKRQEPHEGESKEIRWFSEKEIDGLDTYENAKFALHKAFDAYAESGNDL